MKERLDVMTGEVLLQADQVMVEASTKAQRAAAGILAGLAVVLTAPGGIGVPSPRAEAVTIEVEDRQESGNPKIPRQRLPKALNSASSRH